MILSFAGAMLKSYLASKVADKASEGSGKDSGEDSEGDSEGDSDGRAKANTISAMGQMLYDAVKGRQAGKRAEQAGADIEDPETRAFADEIDRERRAMETGAAFQSERQKIRQMTADTQSSIVDATAGDTASTLSALMQAQSQGGRQMNEVLARGFNRQKYFTNLYNKLNQRIQQRELEMEQLDETQALAEEAQRKKQARANLNAILAQAPSDEGGGNERSFDVGSGRGAQEGSSSPVSQGTGQTSSGIDALMEYKGGSDVNAKERMNKAKGGLWRNAPE
jgi:hypothetical protein